MNLSDPFVLIGKNNDSSRTDEDLAPKYAMNIALQTLRDRCSKLQSRISVLEEENLQLRINFEQPDIMKSSSKKVEKREDSGEKLWNKNSPNIRDKSQTHKNSLPSSKTFPLAKPISSSVLKHEVSDIPVKDDSLEEIPLKGAYSRTSNLSRNKYAIVDSEEVEENLESLNMVLQEMTIQMKKEKEILLQQQEGFKSALEVFKKFMKENSVCKTCSKRDEGVKGRENKIVGTEESLVGRAEGEGFRARERIRIPIPAEEAAPPPLKDRICPLCEKYFHCSTPFDTFNEHVLSHFVEEEEEEKISSNFHVVT